MECLYIDADNISYKSMDIIDNKINLNKICVKKVFGDWGRTELKNWSKKCLDYGLESIQCQYIGKKQSTDIKLTIEIMEDIYKYNINKIYLITSDSDFTHLCNHIKSNNIYLTVISINDSILQNYSNEYINIKNNLSNYNTIELINDIMGNKNIISYTIFKKHYNQYDTKISLETINNYIDSNNDNFIFYKKTKSTKYIIYVYDIVNNNNINDVIDTHKDVFNIISYENLNKIL
jgi:hypothetical protein